MPRSRCGDVDLQVMDQGDQKAACVGAEFAAPVAGVIRSRCHLRILGGPGCFDRLEIGRKIGVLYHVDRLGRRCFRRYILGNDHQILNGPDRIPFVGSPDRTGQKGAQVHIGCHSGLECVEVCRLGRSAPLSGGALPLEEATGEDALRPRSQGELGDDEVADRQRVVTDKPLRPKVGIGFSSFDWRSARGPPPSLPRVSAVEIDRWRPRRPCP